MPNNQSFLEAQDHEKTTTSSSSSSSAAAASLLSLSTPPPLSLDQMAIQSCDTLRGWETSLVIPPTWNDRPPLLIGPRGMAENDELLKGVCIFIKSH
jgi:hypothetical protein